MCSNSRNTLNINQWKKVKATINLFKNTENKKNCTSIQFNIKENILNETNCVKQCISIFNNEIEIIKHCRKSILFYNKN